MRKNSPVLSSAVIVFGFWWLFFTLRDFSMNPFEVIRNWANIAYSMRLWALRAVVGFLSSAWYIWFKRTQVQVALVPHTTKTMGSTLWAQPQ